MFRIQDNIPEVYINESRDFQILARLYDTLFSGVRYDIDTLVNLLDATQIKDRMLELLCTKVGFFPRIDIDANILKYIVASFPYIIKNKGNEVGIKAAVNAILKSEYSSNIDIAPRIIINNKKSTEVYQPYTVYIFTRLAIFNKEALDEVMRYVLPVGYTYQLLEYDVLNEDPYVSLFRQSDDIIIFNTDPYRTSQIGTSDTYTTYGSDNTEGLLPGNELIKNTAKHLLGYLTTDIITSDTYKNYINEELDQEAPMQVLITTDPAE